MYRTNCRRLRQVALSDLSLHVAREGVVVEGRGLIKGDDLLTPQGTVFFEWKTWPPAILGMVRDLLLAAEKHVAEAMSEGDATEASCEPANVLAERAAEQKREDAMQPRVRDDPTFGAPLPPDLFGESDEEDDIASSIKIESQF